MTKVEEIFPTKQIKVFNRDKEWMTDEIQKLRRQKSREYRKNKKSSKYLLLHKKFLELKSRETKKYIEKEIEILRNSNPRQFHQHIKRLGQRTGEVQSNVFKIPRHVEQNFTPKDDKNIPNWQWVALHFILRTFHTSSL